VGKLLHKAGVPWLPGALRGALDRLFQVVRGNGAPWCGWPVEEENRIGPSQAPVPLRRYPFPYRCALSICNDTDTFYYPVFEEFHAFVNGTKPTLLGDGLGLEVGDSLWVWSEQKFLSLYHGLPQQDPPTPSPEIDRLVELGRLGWLDVLHGFGDWNGEWTLDRDRIRFALDRLRDLGLKPSVYVNHGGFNMAHNIGGPWGYYQKGDLPGERSYCLDLLHGFGFRFFWTDVFYETEKYGEHQRFATQAELDEAVARHDFQRFVAAGDSAESSPARTPTAAFSSDEVRRWKRDLFNRVLVPGLGRDGQQLYFFKRFRGRDAPNSGNFILQVNKDRLDDLEAAEACVVVYQHFGRWRALHMGRPHASSRRSVSPVLDEHARWAFRELAERERAGRIFVTTTGRLLTYLWVRDHLDYSVEQLGSQQVLRLKAVNCPRYGKIPLSMEMAQGLSFEIPRFWGEVRVELEGHTMPLECLRKPDPTNPDTDVVMIPWNRLVYPE
jgi:hypothetical protein